MQERLTLIKIAPACILDMGCGEGADLPILKKLFAQAHLIGIDSATEMLDVAQKRLADAAGPLKRLLSRLPGRLVRAADPHLSLLNANFTCLPLRNDVADIVWSNLALHWHPEPQHVFPEWRRLLRNDGLLMFSCFGPDTFKELRHAFAIAGEHHTVPPFVDMHDLGDMLSHAGFSTPVTDMEMITVTYDSVEKLMEDVRGWGGNPLSLRRRALLGKGAWGEVKKTLENLRRTDGRIPLTFEIIYGHAFRPAPRPPIQKDAIVRFMPKP